MKVAEHQVKYHREQILTKMESIAKSLERAAEDVRRAAAQSEHYDLASSVNRVQHDVAWLFPNLGTDTLTRVTVTNDVTTVGTDLRRMHLRLLSCGISVGRRHAMVRRGPAVRGTFDSVPYSASINFPLPLTAPSSCYECLLRRPLRPLLS